MWMPRSSSGKPTAWRLSLNQLIYPSVATCSLKTPKVITSRPSASPREINRRDAKNAESHSMEGAQWCALSIFVHEISRLNYEDAIKKTNDNDERKDLG